MRLVWRLGVIVGAYIVAAQSGSADDLVVTSAAPDPAGIEYFENHIRPLLVEHCYECHSKDSQPVQAGLRLDDRDALRRGGESGEAAVIPGDPVASRLVAALKYTDIQMPPEGKLSDEVIARVERWIAIGAPDPRDPVNATETDLSSADQKRVDVGSWASDRSYWSFQPPSAHEPPPVVNAAWPRERIDYFILAKMEAAGLQPAEEANPEMLVRRLSFDLRGLPPSPDEVQRFVNNPSDDAYEQLADTFMSSPRYGERWARLWLDVARYAEDQAHIVGDDRSLCYPNAFYYRDWLINAFNDDLPYDQFIRLQLAADLIEGSDSPNLPALGFLGLGPKYYNRGTPEVKADEWDDRIDTVSRGLLGLTAACARCHDHKFDPISMHDYYAIAGVFASTKMYNRPLDSDAERKGDGEAKKPETAMHIVCEGEPQNVPVAIRGDVRKPGEVIPRGFFSLVSSAHRGEFYGGSGRQELAEAIVNRQNPLAARVLVNRVWASYFGQGLVTTPSNFGHSGQLPSHPELLDDLAVRFMDNGWSLKWLHREIITSATYRQTSFATPDKVAADPTNRWLSRMSRRRLDVEWWRDALLVASGQLSDQLGGRSINLSDDAANRRTVYAEISRFQLHPMLAMFDFPDPNAHAAGRVPTTTPLQKLFVLNSPFLIAQADHLVQRVEQRLAQGESVEQIVQDIFQDLYARRPGDDEVMAIVGYVQSESMGRPAGEVWRDCVHALLASNEMLFVD